MSSPEVTAYLSTNIENIRRLSPEVLCVTLGVPKGFFWQPGQHVGVTDSPQGKLSYYSIASAQNASNDQPIELAVHEPSIKWQGPIEVGRSLYLSSPSGGPEFSRLSSAARVVLIGMGTGVAPLRGVVQALLSLSAPERDAPGPALTLLHGARDRQNCIFFDEFADLQNDRFTYTPVLSRAQPEEWTGRVGRVQGHLKDFPIESAEFCVCGKLPMVSEVAHLLRERGANEEQIFSEGY